MVTILESRPGAPSQAPATAPARTLRGNGWVALAILVFTFGIYAASPVQFVSDSYWTVFTARSIIRTGNVDLDEYDASIERMHGHDYYAVPLATSLATLPVVAIASVVDGDSLDRALAEGRTRPYNKLGAALLVALSCTLLYLALARVTQQRWVVLASVGGYAFGTQAWSTASRTLWMHAPSMLALSVALYCAVRAARQPGWFGALGATLATAYFVRPTNVVPLLIFAAWACSHGQKAIVRYAVGAGSVASALLLLNEMAYGVALQSYFRGDRISLSPRAIEAALGNLVSPSRGLIVFVPLTLVATYGVFAKRREGAFTRLDVVVVATILGYWIVVSLFPHWWGGWSYGPRFLSDTAPFIAWFLPPAFAALSRPKSRRSLLTIVAVGLLFVSVAINARGALAPTTTSWNWTPADVDYNPRRVWDWSDPQFLR